MAKVFPIGWTPDDEPLSYQYTPWYRMLNRWEWRFALRDLFDSYRFWRVYYWLSPGYRRRMREMQRLSTALSTGAYNVSPLSAGSVLQVESLEAVMQCVTFDSTRFKVKRPSFW